MNKLPDFKNLLELLEKNCPAEHPGYKYIGTGNPNAKILIIGKEASIPEGNKDQKGVEIDSNFDQWKKIEDFDQSKIKDCDCVYRTPLYPYKGQLLKINRNNNCGTSRTWYNYQKLVNLIFDNPENEKIDFHEKVFITEVNSTPSPKTKDANTSSIAFRKKILFQSDFIKSFPIVIIAGLGYFEIDGKHNEIVNHFSVEFIEKHCATNKESQAYWVHYGENPKKLLINTRQLSINVSDALLLEVATVIKKWAEQEKIDLLLNCV